MAETREIAVEVGVGVRDRVAHAGLRGEVHHGIEAVAGEQLRHRFAIGYVDLFENEARVLHQRRQSGLFERHFVVVVEVVDPDHLMTLQAQAPGRVKADESGGAGDENRHEAPIGAVLLFDNHACFMFCSTHDVSNALFCHEACRTEMFQFRWSR
ncbi:hypothetical protein FQZ97_1053340 [compost metagenome]